MYCTSITSIFFPIYLTSEKRNVNNSPHLAFPPLFAYYIYILYKKNLYSSKMLDSKIDVTFNRKPIQSDFAKLNLKVSTCLIMARIYVFYLL